MKVAYLKLLLASTPLVLTFCGPSSRNGTASTQPGESNKERTESENRARQQMGIRQVHPSWHLYKIQFSEEVWTTRPMRGTELKRIHRNQDGDPIWEEDYYYTGRVFTTMDGDIEEHLTIHYSYESDNITLKYAGQNPATEAVLAGLSEKSSNAQKLSVADEILKKWGMSRL